MAFEFHQVQCLCLVYVDGGGTHETQKLQFIVTSAGLFHFDRLGVRNLLAVESNKESPYYEQILISLKGANSL